MLPSIDNSKRIRILTQSEINDLYERPEFTEDERKWYFELNDNEQKLLKMPVKLGIKIDAILQLAYFKVKYQFFKFQINEVQDDVYYIANRYFDLTSIDKVFIGTEAKYINRQRILDLLNYQLYSKKHHRDLLLKKTCELCYLSTDPIFIFRELVEFIFQNKITLPGYTTLQDIISTALSIEQKRINQIIKKHLTLEEKQRILNLLQREEGLYAITLLKKLPKNFQPKAIYREIDYYQNYSPLYQIAKRLLPKFEISKKSIIYYANLIEDHYAVHDLERINQDQACLWLLCFAYHRCQRMLDNLATMFIYVANQYQDDITKKTQELLLADVIDKESQNTNIAKLLRFYTDTTIDGTQPFNSIKDKVYTIVPPEKINEISCDLEKQGKAYQAQFAWNAVDQLAHKYKPTLRALFKILPFESDSHKALKKAIYFLQAMFSDKQLLSKIPFNNFPKQFISKKIIDFIYDKNKQTICPDRYEYYCLQEAKKYLDARSLFLNESIEYRSLSSELIQQWQKNKSKVLHKINKSRLNEPLKTFIHKKAKPLDKKIFLLNEAIDDGKNPDVKIKIAKDGSNSWRLPYKKKSIELNNPFYEKFPQISIIQVLRFVNQQTQFLKEFKHIKPHYAKAQLDELSIYGCLIANGTNLGVLKMSDICDLNFAALNMTDKNFIRLSTLKAANDLISNSIASLPIFKYWNLQKDLLHASLDGQKFKTQRDTLLARYSKKYFGFDKGVVAYSMIANHVPINARIIGANEHESRYLFDLVYNNSSEIQPDVFSTDTEGTNQLNFLLLYIIERIFAPRYRSLTNKTETIISFSDPKQFKDCLIKPLRKLNSKLILDEEDNIKHILASLLIGETMQSSIIGKLSSKNYANRTKRALWEMNAALMSDYLLDYIGDIILRQAVQGALNRGEAYHQLRRYISIINGRNFRGSTEMEIAVWNDCARLLTNAIIYYNATLLTKLMDYYERLGKTEQRDFVKRLSPVAWTHINFYGQYEFLTGGTIDIEGLLDQIIQKN